MITTIGITKCGAPDDPLPVGLHVTRTIRGVPKTDVFWMTEDEAQHLSNRLQSAAKGQGSGLIEVVLTSKA